MPSQFPIPRPGTTTGPDPSGRSAYDPAPLEAASDLHAGNVDIAAHVYKSSMGRTKIHGWVAGSLDEAHELVQQLVKRPAPVGEFLTFAGASCYCKAGKLKGRSRWRHALRGWFRLGHAPCVQEYFNMCWLHNRHFQVPLPLVGGVVRRHGLPAYQFLITRQVLGSTTLDEALEKEPLPAGHPLIGLDNVCHSPHIAGQTAESLVRVSLQTAENILTVLRGEKLDPGFVANPEALAD